MYNLSIGTIDITNLITSGAIVACNSYSTEEQFTGKYWIDGKPIYRKSLYFNNKAFPYKEYVNLGEFPFIDTLTDWEETLISEGYFFKSFAYAFYWYSNEKRIDFFQLFSGGTTVYKTFYLHIEYTKN